MQLRGKAFLLIAQVRVAVAGAENARNSFHFRVMLGILGAESCSVVHLLSYRADLRQQPLPSRWMWTGVLLMDKAALTTLCLPFSPSLACKCGCTYVWWILSVCLSLSWVGESGQMTRDILLPVCWVLMDHSSDMVCLVSISAH